MGQEASTAANPRGSCSVVLRDGQSDQVPSHSHQKQSCGLHASSTGNDVNRSSPTAAGTGTRNYKVASSKSAFHEATPSAPETVAAGLSNASRDTKPKSNEDDSQARKDYKLPGGRTGLAALFSVRGRRLQDVVELDKKKLLGKGTFGIVYRGAVKADPSVKCAVKAMDKTRLKKLKVSEALVRQEVELMKDCSGHENILQLLEVFESSHEYFIVLEYCDGGDLQDAFKSATQGTLAETQVAYLMHQILSAIAFLHAKNICHRDIKPHNLMTVGRATKPDTVVKLGDFGIAVRMPRGKLLTEQVGTPAFMSPEMHLLPKRSKGYDMLVDEWAAGVCMIYLLAHEYPFMDSQGRLLRHELVEGQVPLWAADGFSGLFRRAQEAVGLKGPGPSRLSRGLVRLLLTPGRRQRITAADALLHPWFTDPHQQMPEDGLDDMPLLNWDDFQEGVSLVEREFYKALDGLEDMPMPFVAARRSVDLNDERLINCVVCYEPAGDLCWICGQCSHAVCHKCLDKMRRSECPHCRYAPSGMEIERNVVKLARTVNQEVANLVTEVGVDRTPTLALSQYQRSLMDKCNYCEAGSTATSHVCPMCCASVCHSCAKAKLAPGTEQRCPNCGDFEHNGPALERYFATVDAVGTAFALGGALRSELQNVDIGALGSEVAKGTVALGATVQHSVSQNWQSINATEHIDNMATHVDGFATADMGRMTVNEQERERLDQCFLCKVPSSSLDHFCPACFAAVCSECVHNQLVNNPCCPHCGEAEENGRMVRIRVASWQAYSSAKSLWGGLLDLGSELLVGNDHLGTNGTDAAGQNLQRAAVLPVPDSGDSVEAIDPLSTDDAKKEIHANASRQRQGWSPKKSPKKALPVETKEIPENKWPVDDTDKFEVISI